MKAGSKTTQERAAKQAALDYHALPTPGKLEIRPTKPLASQRDLSRAYSPGVAYACTQIADDSAAARRMTSRGNLVGVVSNGSAVLGLGDIGPLAAKPVMEGKAVLFKKFANIDCFDIEVNETDPTRLAEVVCALEPTFGAINLEDIKAPDCFAVERICRERMNIPVFHDDQHGTAIVVAAAAINALMIVEKEMSEIKIVSTGGGAAGIACLELLVTLGARRENIWLCDIDGLVHEGRTVSMTSEKTRFARATDLRTLDQVIDGADFFIGLSGPNVLTRDMVARMASRPVIFALANPVPEIDPDVARACAPDAIIATGRSDYPNQVNNVLCFPFIFRGALDVGATRINTAMEIACAEAIASLARETTSAEAAAIYRGERLQFGPEYLIPKPFDPRLTRVVASAVAQSAMETGVATRPLPDLEAYRHSVDGAVYRSVSIMKLAFDAAKHINHSVIFAEGEDERVLRAASAMLEEGIGSPILIGRPRVVRSRIERAGLSIRPGEDLELIDPEDDRRYGYYWREYHAIVQRRGVTPDIARSIMRTNTTAIAGIAVRRGDATSMVCGTYGQYLWHLRYVEQILSDRQSSAVAALSLLILPGGPMFVADTQVHMDPSTEQIATTAIEAARHVRYFGIEPRIALCSCSQFGNLDTPDSRKMREARELLERRGCDFAVEGEMSVDLALDPDLRARIFPNATFDEAANVLIFPNLETASAVRNTLRSLADGLEVGPILMGLQNKAHIVTPTVTARGLLNISALAGTPMGN